MDKQKYIIDKIISDAKTTANNLVASAKKDFDGQFKQAKNAEEHDKEIAIALAIAEIGEAANNKTNLKNQALRKQRIAYQYEMLDKVYLEVKKDLLKNKTFIKKIIAKYQEKGDKVVETKDGVILHNIHYDKVLTIDNLLKDVREATQSEVARILFEQ